MNIGYEWQWLLRSISDPTVTKKTRYAEDVKKAFDDSDMGVWYVDQRIESSRRIAQPYYEGEYSPENVFKLILMIAAIPLAIWMLCEVWDYFHAYYDIYALAYGRTE